MYQVSEELNDVLAGQVIDHRIRGVLTAGGDAFDIGPSDIVPGSLTINNKAISDSDFNLGAVYVGELSVTLMKDIDRYSLYGAKVEFWDDYTLGDGSVEPIPLGVFYVDDARRTKKLIALKCYDCMTAFDKVIAETIVGTAWELVSAACVECGVTFEQTEDDFGAFVNADVLQCIELDSMETYREGLSSIAKTLGGFFTINRDGALELRGFMTEPCMSIPPSRRESSTICDYGTYFRGVGCKFIAEQNHVTYTAYSADMKGTGTFVDLGDIPSVRGLPELKHKVLGAILATLEGIEYVPTEFDAIADPRIELGDMLTLERINNTGDSCVTIVTSIDHTYHGTTSVKSVGYDSKLSNVRDKADRFYSQAVDEAEKAKTVVYTATNAKDLSIGDQSVTLCEFYFASTTECKPLCFLTVPIECSDDGNIIVEYYKDDIEQEHDRITHQVVRGWNAVTLVNWVQMDGGTRCNLEIKARLESAETFARSNEARISQIDGYMSESTADGATVISFEDYKAAHPATARTDVPHGKVGQFKVKGAVFCQGLAGEISGWDGTINVNEWLGRIDAANGITARFDAGRFSFAQQVPMPAGISESLPRIEAASGQMLLGFGGMGGFEYVAHVESWTFPNEENVGTYDRLVVVTPDGYTTQTEWTFESEPENIDVGTLAICETWCEDIDVIDEVEVIE